MSDDKRQLISLQLARELRSAPWREPWWCFCLEDESFGRDLETEFRAELGQTHSLYPANPTARAIAKREDCDDVLFWLPDAAASFAIVHLTWKGRPSDDPALPLSTSFASLDRFVERELIPLCDD